MFSIKNRDGPSRLGKITIEKTEVITPNIFFLNTNRLKAPKFADIILTNNDAKIDKPKLKNFNKSFLEKPIIELNEKSIFKSLNEDVHTVLFAAQLFEQPRKFTDMIVKLREKIGYQKIIYLPSIGDPTNFALLSYIGVDFFDSTAGIIAGRNNILLLTDGAFKKDDFDELTCNCPICQKFENKSQKMSFQDILNHNYNAMRNEIKTVRNAIKRGNLRNLVENRVKTTPDLTAILRNLDMNHYNYLERRTPTTGKQIILATSKESLNRPEIKRFQKRVIQRYRKPESTKILLLLPCSAKKPYSFSKSHKLFREQLFSTENPFVIHELIITSPLGLVPRELELVYPASSYDIPVTGVWDEDEKNMIRNLLAEFLKKNKYAKIISHLPKEIMEFTQDILEKPDVTCIDNPTSDKSLEELSKTLKKNVKNYEKVKPQKRAKEDILSLASYQFGNKIAEKLLKDCVIKGKYPYQKIMHDNTQLGMITEERGFISLTIDGAERIMTSGKYWVEIYDDFTLKGSVFAPGVKDADSNIRIGDEVIVIQKEKLCAVGVAQMNGEEMKESTYGEAVKVRHIV